MLSLNFRSIFSWQSQLSQQPCFSCALSAVYFSWPAQVQIFRQTKISQKFIKKSSFYPLLGLTCFILRWKVNKFKLVFLVMDELAKSGVRTRKRNKSIKDSAKLVSHRIYLKKMWNRGIYQIDFSNFQNISWNWWTSLVVHDSFTRFWIVKKSKYKAISNCMC